MKALLLFPLLALLALAAHFLRGSEPLLVGVCLICCPMCFSSHRWAHRAVQAVLLLGSLEWGLTLASLVAIRQAAGQPWLRLAVILGLVSGLTGLAALVFQLRRLRQPI